MKNAAGLINDYIKRLERENTRLRKQRGLAPQAQVISVEHPSVLPADDYARGFEDSAQLLHKLEAQQSVLTHHIAALHMAANCDNGPRTREAMKFALAQYAKTLQEMSIEIGSVRDHPLVKFRGNVIAGLIEYTSSLRTLAEQCLIAKTDTAQSRLRDFIAQHADGLKPLCDEIESIKKRGANRNRVYAYIGKVAAAKKQPKRGQWWKAGKEIYDELNQIPEALRSKDQSDSLTYLSEAGYFYERTGEVADKRGLGTYISEARAIHLARNSSDLSRSNNSID